MLIQSWFSIICFAQLYKLKTLASIIVKSTYKEPAYKELPVIRNWFSFPNLYHETSSLYVYKELML